MDIGNKIKLLRQKIGATQEQLGEKIGVSAQSISKWETGVTMPDITLLPILSSELGVTIDELFDLTTDQKLQRIENTATFSGCFFSFEINSLRSSCLGGCLGDFSCSSSWSLLASTKPYFSLCVLILSSFSSAFSSMFSFEVNFWDNLFSLKDNSCSL